jgi:NAD(P)-dependent dehydrogenase (short-subunit alcohol dehydrogenase family)
MSAPTAGRLEELLLKAMPRYRWTADRVAEGVSLAGRNVIVTGATSGIGVPTAVAMARTGCNLTITARDRAKGAAVLEQVRRATGSTTTRVAPLDLADLASVTRFAAGWGDAPVHVLLHNAGVMAAPFALTSSGFEQQMQVNFFAVVLLTELLDGRLPPDARVVAVSSSAHRRVGGALGPILPLFHKYARLTDAADYDKWVAYAVSKTAVIMYMNAVDAEYVKAGRGVRCVSLHPGGIMTGLQANLGQEEMRNLGWLDAQGHVHPVFKTVEQGAATGVWCSTSAELNGVGGVYCENCEITPKDEVSPPANDATASLVSRLRGTAPHVWNADDNAAVASAARELLRSKALL